MGLDAHVFCNCLRDKKIKTEPPVEMERIYIDPAEGILEIRYPEGLDKKEENDLWYAVDRWSQNSCEHENMYYCDVRVGNWSSVRTLQEAVMESGEYPVLSSIWPSGNGGMVDRKTAESASAELEQFCKKLGDQQGLFLIDAGSGESIYSYINCYDGIFSMGGKAGVDIGFDQNGLFVRDRNTKDVLFRSLHMRQELLPVETRSSVKGKKYSVTPALLTDIRTGQTWKISSKIGVPDSPAELKVIERNLTEQDFYAIEPLRLLFQAAAATGNPIFWT